MFPAPAGLLDAALDHGDSKFGRTSRTEVLGTLAAKLDENGRTTADETAYADAALRLARFNVNTGVVERIEDHPIDKLVALRFRVTVNTDNRLMSGVTMSSEMAALVDAFEYDWARLRWLTVNAMKSSFLPFRERLQIIEQIIKPRYAPLEAWQVEPPL